ncbi:MAG: VCBS repeat-containing protein [Chloracidobacterium sp.]|nr:VCBS repeat-containing protein [Chloracidobacterium sp.]MCO5333320.1 VCBS repeat-containing protein [Pyrinomonadaceae bacterium]
MRNFALALIVALAGGAIYIASDIGPSTSAKNTDGRAVRQTRPSSVLFNDDFTYTGLLSANGWTAHSGSGTNALTAAPPGLTYTGYPGSGIGNAVSLTTSGEDDHHTFTVQESGSVYAGVMVNLSDAALDPSNGDYFFHLGPDPIGSTFRAKVFAKKGTNGKIAFGISKGSNNTTTPPGIGFTDYVYDLNTTHLLVAKYTIIDGASNDTAELLVDPNLSGAEPAASATALDNTTFPDINPGAVALRQGQSANAATLKADGIRVTTSWGDLAGTAPQPKAVIDFNGDGKTDFAVVRGTDMPLSGFTGQEVRRRPGQHRAAAPQAPAIFWYTSINGSGDTSVQKFGDSAADQITPADFDGDGKTDLAVWREAPATQAAFYILRSSDGTVDTQVFGQDGDDPAVVGDYDGDGKADPAVYRCPEATPGQCYFFYRGSDNNPAGNITYVPWGFGAIGDFYPSIGDFDGDGKYDFCIQREDPSTPGQAQFVLLKTTGGVDYINWGLTTDFIIPGDFDGDGMADLCVRRSSGGLQTYYILTRAGAMSQVQWGLVGDISVPGDYDGDGKTDIAAWRQNADPTQNYFYVQKSTNGALMMTEWGQQFDYPIAGWAVH